MAHYWLLSTTLGQHVQDHHKQWIIQHCCADLPAQSVQTTLPVPATTTDISFTQQMTTSIILIQQAPSSIYLNSAVTYQLRDLDSCQLYCHLCCGSYSTSSAGCQYDCHHNGHSAGLQEVVKEAEDR